MQRHQKTSSKKVRSRSRARKTQPDFCCHTVHSPTGHDSQSIRFYQKYACREENYSTVWHGQYTTKSGKVKRAKGDCIHIFYGRILIADISSPNSNYNSNLRRPLFRVVKRFVALQRIGWRPCTSKKLKYGVGKFSGRCCEKRFTTCETSGTTQKKCREAGKSTSLSVTLSAPDSPWFCLTRLQQNAQCKGNAEGSKV